MNLRFRIYAVLFLGGFCLTSKAQTQVRKPAQNIPATTKPRQVAPQGTAAQPAARPAAQTVNRSAAQPAAQSQTNNPAVQPATRPAVQPGTRPAPARAGTPTQRPVKTRVAKVGRPGAFYYVSGSFFSFADQIFAKVSGQKTHARAVFTGYTLGSDYTRYVGRYIYSWNLNILTGTVDIQRVLGTTYPRLSFFGAQSGPEIGYRVNSDLDLTYGLNLLYRDIEKVGPSFALDNQLNIKFRFSPRLTFFQSLGNYGKPTSYSYSIGLRWLL